MRIKYILPAVLAFGFSSAGVAANNGFDDVREKLKASGFLNESTEERVVKSDMASWLYAKGARDATLDFYGDLATGTTSYNWTARRVDSATICFKADKYMFVIPGPIICLVAVPKDAN